MILLSIKLLILDASLHNCEGGEAAAFRPSSSTTAEHYDLDRVLDRSSIGILDLRTARKSRLHNVSLGVVRNDRSQLLDEHRALRARADEIHISADHIDELREFVESQLANDASNPSNARIV